MTANELTSHFNDTFALGEWPKTFEVNHETYANVCQFLLEHLAEYWPDAVHLAIGSHKGIMFKGVELILVSK